MTGKQFLDLSLHHRWEHLLKQQISITVYCSLTKENKLPLAEKKVSLPFPFSVCSKQTEVADFH
jgi:hypothetical protein